MNQISPFLHRDERPGGRQYRPDANTYQAELNKVAAARTLERLRYRWYERRGTLGCLMQRLGDWGRHNFPWIGRGWNGIGAR